MSEETEFILHLLQQFKNLLFSLRISLPYNHVLILQMAVMFISPSNPHKLVSFNTNEICVKLLNKLLKYGKE